MTKHFFTLFFLFMSVIKVNGQGWPQNYDGVMIQGFYWDSYADTKWTNLESQADELAKYFSLIWIPQSGYCNSLSYQMGYSDIWWLDHKSAFGTEDELRSMIKTFKSKGLGTIADVVINHKNGNKSWTDFPDESKIGQNTGKTYTLRWGNSCAPYICKTDECVKSGYSATGAVDTGDDFNGARDLDHTNATVQENIKIYLDFLLNELGYAGFRYDMVKGYGAKFVGIYNTSCGPTFSVGECWDNYNVVSAWINGTKQDNQIQSAAFDFPMRDNIKQAFGNGDWNKLSNQTLASSTTYRRYAVTFVDNHDTGSSGKDGADPLYRDIEAANAYLLAMPGTPCVFLSHWKSYKTTIKKLITLRHLLGINSMSDIISAAPAQGGYVINVKGAKGNALVAFGSATPSAISGYKQVLNGLDYKYYVTSTIDVSALDDIKDDSGFTAPSCCVINYGETCAFFEAPSTWNSTIKCWCWDKDGGKNYTGGSWPGATCTKVGKASNGNNVWKWSCTNSFSAMTPMVIFSNNGSPQTSDMTFVNGGYYNKDGYLGKVTATTGIEDVTIVKNNTSATYNLAGQRVGKDYRGLVIINGKKIVK